MHVKIFGTRGEIKISNRQHKKHSGILIDKKILLDLGEKEYLNCSPKVILITHLHPDHAFFVSTKEKTIIPIPVYAPEESGKLETIKVIKKPLLFDDYKITPVPVVHSLKVSSQGYLVEKGRKRLFYTGDMVSIDKKYFHQLHNLDMVITEASFIRRGGVVRKNINGQQYGHTGVPDLVDLFKKFTSRIIFTHFGTWFIKDGKAGREKINQLKEKDLVLEICYDRKEFLI